MKKIDVVYFGYLGSSVGPVTNLKLFMKHCDLFKKNNIDLTVFAKDKVDDENNFENIPYVNSQLAYKIKNILNPISHYSYLVTIFLIYRQYFYNAKGTMLNYLKHNRQPDGMFFQDIFSCYYFLKFRKENHSKVVLMMRNNGDTWKMLYEYYPKAEGYFIMKKLKSIELFILNNIEKIGFVSENSMNNFISLNPDFKHKAFFVHNGLPDLKRFDFPVIDKKIVLVCAGTINSRKGQDLIVDAICELDMSVQEKLKVVFLGDGPMLKTLETKINKFNLAKTVDFVGNTSDVNRYLEESHGFILCSRDEGLPMSIIEAMRAGRAIFSTRVAGIPELINENVSGILIMPEVEEVKELLIKIASGCYDLKLMGDKSRELYEKSFTLNRTIEGFCNILNENC